ncbi:zinc-dependent alcohol dehydrogenase [Pseudalkalibacillus salsuginis]|uniref:zinc-dependent alcohol dehydrogenase n=1 Tax=Pseudalkalibacillus salsuginis TaxID=2910972 RepID=UPI001F1A6971|nr:alcohol dehydrogenase catalytic domain-containing protein [Pseudalkalibacillus salsuginis]MCF6409451.1 alcohol dehydrogenase catalytic domain-containing protein [Pseudalkalibacillus salsuginis]
MKAIQFNFSKSRYIFSKVAGRFLTKAYWDPRFSCLQYTDHHRKELPNDDWLRVEVKYSGICGSDLNLIFLKDSPATSPYVSFPFTIGHEIVGTVTEIGSNVKGIQKGQRVAVDPILSCEVRGIEKPCRPCQEQNYSLCERKTEGAISPGLLTGACRDTSGGWSPCIVAHKSQIFSLPDEVDDLNGVLVEPFSCAIHSVMRSQPKQGDTVLVIGGGVLGLSTIAAIRALGFPCKIASLVKYGFQGELATYYGADEVIHLSGSGYDEAFAKAIDATVLSPLFGPKVIEGGADIVFECVGRQQSINDALRFTRNGGRVVLLGLAGIMDGIDWTTVWLNELEIKGTFAYSTETYQGKRLRTFELAIQLIKEGKVDLSPMITHRFQLENYQKALRAVSSKGKKDAVKVVFEP